MKRLSEIIDTINHEIEFQYVGGCISWSDEKFNNGWSIAIDEFDKAIQLSIDTNDYELAMRAGTAYKNKCLYFIKEYKKERAINDSDAFLRGIKNG